MNESADFRPAWLCAPATPFTRWLERWRFVFFAIIAILVVAPFNGQWRIGLDSSIYRGVAENLAAGHGYVFAGRAQTMVYPGLPFLLAGFQKITGTDSVVGPLVLLNLAALLTLVITYRLIQLRYPTWIAVIVTCGVGINVKFIQQAHEVMTDTPFLLGCVTALLGWELWSLARTRRAAVLACVLFTGGLFIAATLRPTFWVIAAAFGLVAVWRGVRHRERRAVLVVAALTGVLILFALLDPRVRGLNFLKGGYEKQFLLQIPQLFQRLIENAPKLFTHELPEAFFNEQLWYFGLPMSLLLLLGAVLLTRREPVWGLQVLLLSAIMLVLSDVPRYYVMVLPQLWLGYVLVLLWLSQKFPLWLRDWMLFTMITAGNAVNLAGGLSLLQEQHTGVFADQYNRGFDKPLVEAARVINGLAGPDDVVIGPYAQVLSYLSKRQVLGGKLLDFETRPITKYPKIIAAASPRYIVGPQEWYEKKDREMYRLIMRGVVKPGRLVTTTRDGLWIAEAVVTVPDGDWRDLPISAPRPLGNPRPTRTPGEIARRELKASRERKRIRTERLDRQARNERKRIRREREQRKSATQPAAKVIYHLIDNEVVVRFA